MREIAVGDVVRSKAGHDKGVILLVLAAEGEYLALADGKSRKAEKPKRKKRKHVQFIAECGPPVTAAIRAGGVQNFELRAALQPYQIIHSQHSPAEGGNNLGER